MNYNENGIFLAGQQLQPSSGGCRSCGGETPSGSAEDPGTRRRNASSFYRAGRPAQMMDNKLSMQLAMAYVPWQQWDQTNPINQALIRGTLFPELDFPFVMGRCR